MGAPYDSRMTASEALETYFIDNRARLLEIASFLDRIDRYEGSAGARSDFRYRALIQALQTVVAAGKNRTEKVQLLFSDHSSEPIESAVGLKAYGASRETVYEGD